MFFSQDPKYKKYFLYKVKHKNRSSMRLFTNRNKDLLVPQSQHLDVIYLKRYVNHSEIYDMHVYVKWCKTCMYGGWREMYQYFRALATLVEDLSLVPITTWKLTTTCNSIPRDPTPSSKSCGHCMHMVHLCTHKPSSQIHTIKINTS